MRLQADDLLELQVLGSADSEFLELLELESASLKAQVDKLFRETTRGPRDHLPCCIVIKAGGGGNEACLWAAMLLRMYCQYAKRKNLNAELLDIQNNEPSGVKYVMLRFEGPNAYGLLKEENGIHRLSRISPLGHSERHTSFCSVSVFSELEPSEAIKINEKDVEMSFCCGSGPGGQNKNKRATVVRIKHIPTGISVRCETERSQGQNRRMALVVLMSKLVDLEKKKKDEENKKDYKGRSNMGFGGKDRTYVLVPQSLVHDHRTGKKVKDAQRVLDGDLDLLRD